MQFARTVFLLRLVCVCALIVTLWGCGLVDSAGEGVNQPPTVTPGDDQSVNEQTPVTLTSSVTDDFDNIVSYQWAQKVDDEKYKVTLSGANASEAHFVAPVVTIQEGSQVLHFTLTVTDNFGEQGVGTVNVTVNPVNTSPVANNDSVSTNEDFPVNINIIENDIDSDDGTIDPATVKIVDHPANGAVDVKGDGSVMYTPTPNFFGSDVFSYTVDDNEMGTSNVAEVSVSVASVDDPPTISDMGNITIDEDTSTGPIPFTVSDPDTPLDSLTVSASSSNTTLIPNANLVLGGAGGSRTITVTPAANQAGSSATITVSVSDGNRSSNDTFVVTVQAFNDSPTISDIANQTIDVNQSAGPIPFTVIDPDTPLDSLTVSASSSNTSLIPNINLIILKVSDGNYTITVTPAADQSGSATITVSVSDGNSSSNDTFDVTVNSDLASDFAKSISESSACWTTPQAQTLNGSLVSNASSSLATYRIIANGKKGVATIVDATTGDFQYVPNPTGERGIDTFTYEIDDPDKAITTDIATVIVEPAIMVLGDSISEGVTDGTNRLPAPEQRTGFRKQLYDALTGLGFKFDFIGTQNAGFGVADFDEDNEAHSNWNVSEIAFGRSFNGTDGIFAWLEINPADIILLHIGSYGLMSSADQVRLILDEIKRWEISANGNAVTVLLAQIIDQNPINPEVTAFNNSLAEMVRERTADLAFADRIILVDQHSALDYPADLADTIHPTEAGYGKMAEVWRDALITHGLLEKCP
jgi:hypothetical protein